MKRHVIVLGLVALTMAGCMSYSRVLEVHNRQGGELNDVFAVGSGYVGYLAALDDMTFERLGVMGDTVTAFKRCAGKQMYKGVTPDLRARLDRAASGQDQLDSFSHMDLLNDILTAYPDSQWNADMDANCPAQKKAFYAEVNGTPS